MTTLHLGVVASHGGTNLQAILDACAHGDLDARVRLVVSNNSRSVALDRARAAGVPWAHLSSATHPGEDELDRAFVEEFDEHGVELVCLAGYMKKLGPRTLARYRNRVLNIHPAPLPRFGGQGMFPPYVHEAVLASGVTESAATIHLCDDVYDHGAIVAHVPVPIEPGDTVETLAPRVLAREVELYTSTLRRIASGEIDLDAL